MRVIQAAEGEHFPIIVIQCLQVQVIEVVPQVRRAYDHQIAVSVHKHGQTHLVEDLLILEGILIQVDVVAPCASDVVRLIACPALYPSACEQEVQRALGLILLDYPQCYRVSHPLTAQLPHRIGLSSYRSQVQLLVPLIGSPDHHTPYHEGLATPAPGIDEDPLLGAALDLRLAWVRARESDVKRLLHL